MGRALILWIVLLVGVLLCAKAVAAIIPFVIGLLILLWVVSCIQSWLARWDNRGARPPSDRN